MNRSKIWIVAISAVIVIVAVSWIAYQANAKKSVLNNYYAFVYKTKDQVNWFKVTERKGKVTGYLNETILEENPKRHFDPNLFINKYKLTGKTVENGYEFQVKQGKETVTYKVHPAEKHLSVKKQGEKKSITYKAVDQNKLRAVQKDIHDRYDELMEDSENRFHDYVRNFIKKVTGAYGYLYTAEDGSYQLFLKVKRMYMQSEWAGSFLMRTVPGDGGEPYKETKHTAGGVSDGIMFDLSTYPAIEKGFTLGETDRDATSIKFPFKMAGGTIEFKAVTKEEYQEQTEAFKKQAEEKKK
ncbi:hypothetical protein [Bacillus safensis]|uniref:hypothetical protein n=1 Tax=Bacillus safensis TaxID=561879 RepID=UPI000CCC92EF|nr:hypothetical protein [Bacillus safensis]MCY7568763.1 hypothetical protein [Bacillus safensis]MEC1414436.1 hypothetical protein [Bacillus safensis]PNU25428.1 hypothetical protein C1954_04300 [Bacillus stratosphericus]